MKNIIFNIFENQKMFAPKRSVFAIEVRETVESASRGMEWSDAATYGSELIQKIADLQPNRSAEETAKLEQAKTKVEQAQRSLNISLTTQTAFARVTQGELLRRIISNLPQDRNVESHLQIAIIELPNAINKATQDLIEKYVENAIINGETDEQNPTARNFENAQVQKIVKDAFKERISREMHTLTDVLTDDEIAAKFADWQNNLYDLYLTASEEENHSSWIFWGGAIDAGEARAIAGRLQRFESMTVDPDTRQAIAAIRNNQTNEVQELRNLRQLREAQELAGQARANINDVLAHNIMLRTILTERNIVNPRGMVVGNDLYIEGNNNIWVKVNLTALEGVTVATVNTVGTFFVTLQDGRETYLTALKNAKSLDDGDISRINQIMHQINDPRMLFEILEGGFTLRDSVHMTLEQALQIRTDNAGPLEEQISGAVNAGSNAMFEKYGLTTYLSEATKNSIRASMLARARQVLSQIDWQTRITTMQQERKEDFTAAGREEDPPVITEITVSFLNGFIPRIAPKQMLQEERMRYAGGAIDQLKNTLRDQISNPFADIPIFGGALGSMYLMLKNTPLKGLMEGLGAMVAKMTGKEIPVPKTAQEVEEQVQQQVRETLNSQINIDELAVLYAPLTAEELLRNASAEGGLANQQNKSTILTEDINHFSGTITIRGGDRGTMGRTVRFTEPVRVESSQKTPPQTTDAYANKNVENIYVAPEQELTLTLTDQKLGMYSIFPLQTSINKNT